MCSGQRINHNRMWVGEGGRRAGGQAGRRGDELLPICGWLVPALTVTDVPAEQQRRSRGRLSIGERNTPLSSFERDWMEMRDDARRNVPNNQIAF